MESAGQSEIVEARLSPASSPRVWMENTWRELRAAWPEQRVYWLSLAAVLCLGLFQRLNGFINHQSSFWLDEALWAPRFLTWSFSELNIRPIGFVWLTRKIVEMFGAWEVCFRLIPHLAGLASLALMPYVAARLLRSRVLRVVLVFLFAVHPALVDLSKEFKPYSFEVFLHLLTVAVFLRYQQTQRRAWLFGLLAFLPVGFLLGYNMAFAFPSLLLLVLVTGLRSRSKELVLAAVLSGVVCAGVVYELNSHALHKVNDAGKAENYWGRKYDVFYQAESGQGRVRWTLTKTADLLAITGLVRDLWSTNEHLAPGVGEKLAAVDRWLWIGLGVLGLAALLPKRREQALLLGGPLLVLVAVNALGKWPLGEFRTNLFACAYLMPLPLLALEAMAGWLRGNVQLALLGLLVADAAGGFVITFDAHGHKRCWAKDGYSREVLQTLIDFRKLELAHKPSSRSARPARLVLDLFSHKPLDFYLGYHPTYSQYQDFFRENFRIDRVASTRLIDVSAQRLRGAGMVYAVASKGRSAAELTAYAAANPSVVVRQKRIDDNVLIVVLDR